jgi:peptidoglycan/xylan/chitin deacetylase (PgdA/CDA1 family)
VTDVRLDGWIDAPVVGVVAPDEGAPGWTDAAFWSAQLEAWGVVGRTTTVRDVARTAWTTLVVPAALDPSVVGAVPALERAGVLVCGAGGPAADAFAGRPGVVRFDASADALERSTTEDVVDAAERAFLEAATAGVIAVWRWPGGKDVALVVDGDVDHPSGVDPECARYVVPAIETAVRAGYDAYGIFAAAANVAAEPSSFPPGAEYYNHSYTHPYSHWNARPWEDLDESEMRGEIRRSDEAFRRHLGTDDRRIFRLPHFQLEACDRTYDVLEQLGYLAESSIGGNVSVTGGLPFHPSRSAWSSRPEDAAYARTHPDPVRRRPFLQLPISTDPTDPSFLNGCCSYNTLGEGVRSRTAEPEAYEGVLQQVVDRAAERRGLAHLFIDPPDAGYGRLDGDRQDYASAVERWLSRAAARNDVAVLSTSALARWWLAREAAVASIACRVDDGRLVVWGPDAPAGATLAVRTPGDRSAWTLVPIPREPR